VLYGWKYGVERDQLTSLFTRSFFEKEIWPRERERANRYGHPISIMLIDMDGLKRINDTKGHLAGDRALRGLVAGILRQIRRPDILIRYGGDEFLLILPETDVIQARMLGERMQENMPKMIQFSFGVAEGQSLGELLEEADKELYAQKRAKGVGGD